MYVRDFTPRDRDGCLAIFDGNTPPFFAPDVRAEFAAFLEECNEPYFVVEHADVIEGCGGFFVIPNTPVAVLSWGMVDRSRHRQGIGSLLLFARLQRLCQDPGVTVVKLQTSQYSRGFFERAGFEAEEVIMDGYAPGLDLVKMALALDSGRRAVIAQEAAARNIVAV